MHESSQHDEDACGNINQDLPGLSELPHGLDSDDRLARIGSNTSGHDPFSKTYTI